MASKSSGDFAVKRIYLPPDEADGRRVLVDRLWPRGVAKKDAHVDLWLKEIAPSTALRKWFGHDPARFDEFRRRYGEELEANAEAVASLRREARGHRVTLLYSAHDETHNQARVLADFLQAQR